MGYRVGIMLLITYYEVEFYYILAFCILRTLFISYVIDAHYTANNNIAIVCWIVGYYINYMFSFNPLIGINKTIISYNFINYQTTNTYTTLYGPYSTNYPTSSAYNNTNNGTNGLNLTFNGAVIFFTALIIWAGETFTNRYKLVRIDWKFPIYCLFGVMLFFVGLSSALNIDTVRSHIF
jgi:hypothetical protein